MENSADTSVDTVETVYLNSNLGDFGLVVYMGTENDEYISIFEEEVKRTGLEKYDIELHAPKRQRSMMRHE